jgi:hypothetical protein
MPNALTSGKMLDYLTSRSEGTYYYLEEISPEKGQMPTSQPSSVLEVEGFAGRGCCLGRGELGCLDYSTFAPSFQCLVLNFNIFLTISNQFPDVSAALIRNRGRRLAPPRQRGIISSTFFQHAESEIMARKRSSKSSSKRRYSASQIALYVISLIVVLTMAIGFVISMLPTPTQQQTVATPTPIILTTPTSTPTAEPSVTPTSATEAPVPSGPATPQSDQ